MRIIFIWHGYIQSKNLSPYECSEVINLCGLLKTTESIALLLYVYTFVLEGANFTMNHRNHSILKMRLLKISPCFVNIYG